MLAVHADWSIDARKRWMVRAHGRPGHWRLGPPEPVGDPSSLLARLRADAGNDPVALGVDFPIGLPRAYAAAAGVDHFPTFLAGLAATEAFFEVCERLDQISLARPFYPRRPTAGMRRAAHAAALGLAGPAALSRACDRATATRPAGAPLFWTLGANQTGKAAISAWRELLLPAIATDTPPLLWPFAGDFRALLGPGRTVIAETYPAEALRQLGLRLPGSKRRQPDRRALAPALAARLATLSARPDPALRAAIDDGFGADPPGEDRLDCLLGLMSVLLVLAGQRPDTAPPDPAIRRIEGWVLGQTDLPTSPHPHDPPVGNACPHPPPVVA